MPRKADNEKKTVCHTTGARGGKATVLKWRMNNPIWQHRIHEKEMTLTEYAEETGVSVTALHCYESGKRNLGIESVKRVAKFMGMEAGALLVALEGWIEERPVIGGKND